MPKHDTVTQARRRRFLETLAETRNVTVAARAAGIARRAVLALRDRDHEFAEAWADAARRGRRDRCYPVARTGEIKKSGMARLGIYAFCS